MSEENELLNADIESRINKARRELPPKEKEKKPIFYITIILLMTIAVLYGLFRRFF